MALHKTIEKAVYAGDSSKQWQKHRLNLRMLLQHGLRGSLIEQLTNAKRHSGDYLRINLAGPIGFYVLSDPSAIEYVMVKNQKNYERGEPDWTHLRKGLGNGLVTSDGETHRANRKIVLGCLSRNKVARYANCIEYAVQEITEDWTSRLGQTIDLYQEMVSHTLLIIGRVLLGIDLSTQLHDLMKSIQYINDSSTTIDASLLGRAGFIPTASVRRLNKAVVTLDKLLYSMIAERKELLRQGNLNSDDVLSDLLRYQAANINNPNQYERLTDKEIRDELATLFSAGHETSACMLSWTWLLLSKNKQSLITLRKELVDTVAGRVPTIEDLPKLQYTNQVVLESMRIYPPVWINGRQAIDEDSVNGYHIKPGMMIWIPSYLVHHDERWYPNPEQFAPERFDEKKRRASDFTYFPFGGGSRLCVGSNFAMMEGVLTLAGLVQKFDLERVDNSQIQPYPLVSLTPRGGMPMKLSAVC